MSEPISEERLGDYVDGLLSDSESVAIERLLARSAAARDTVDFLRSLRASARRLPAAIEPRSDLWPDIRERMAPAPLAPVEDAPRVAGGEARPRGTVWWPRLQARQWAALAAAAMFLVGSSSAITAWMMGGGVTPGTAAGDPAAVSSVALGEGLPLEARYALQIEQLLGTLHDNRETLDPDTVTTIETNLRVIDRAIRSARKALDDDPSNAGLSRMLDSSYRRKLDLLQRANRIIEMS